MACNKLTPPFLQESCRSSKKTLTYRDTTSNVDGSNQSETPCKAHSEPRIVLREDLLSNCSTTKSDQNGGSQELGERLSELLPW